MKVKTKLDMLKKILGESEVPFTFLGNKAVQKMQNGNLAEVTLSQGGVSGKYTGLRVVIMNKNDGEVTGNVFNFEQYLGDKADRTHQNSRHVSGIHVWEDRGNGFDWYIVRPTDLTPLIDAILEYIIMYS